MASPFWIDRDEDEDLAREYKLSTGSSVHFKRYPPHGLWKVSFSKGAIPKELEGEWSDYKRLYNKTIAYLENKRNPSKVIEEIKEDGP